MLISLIALLISTSRTMSTFPTDMRGSWGDDITDCEPEFVHGQTIEARNISYYEGDDMLIGATLFKFIRTPYGPGRTIIARLKYRFHDDTSRSVERFTVVGQWLYRSDSKLALSKHFARKNRHVRCPAGSTRRAAAFRCCVSVPSEMLVFGFIGP